MANAMHTPDTPAIISRDEARALGMKFFFTGEPCDNKGHIAERYVSTAHCLACRKLPKGRVYVEKGCSVDGCDKKHQARGLCVMHYKLFKRNGDPLARKHAAKWSTMQWIEDSKDYDGDECLIWPFALRGKQGYGKTQFRGKNFAAHIAMCIVCHGEKPGPKMVVAHSCGNGHLGCVNPKHLRWATHIENAADRVLHGTQPYGEKCYQAILKSDDIPKIRELSKIKTPSQIGKLFGVTSAAIHNVLVGRSWKWVD